MFNSWKPVFQVDDTGKWYDNALRFETIQEAKDCARDLAFRWTAVRAHSAMPDEATPNFTFIKGELMKIEKEKK